MRTEMINSLPNTSRVWVYAADRVLNTDESFEIDSALKNFAAQWSAHKVQLTADAALLNNCFIVLMVDEANTGASGCSIDSSVRFVKELGIKFQVNFFNRMLLHYPNDNSLNILAFDKATDDYSTGAITDDTYVFNTLVTSKEQLKTQWLIKLIDSPLHKFVATAAHKAFTLTL